MLPTGSSASEGTVDVSSYAAGLDAWLATTPSALRPATRAHPVYEDRVAAMCGLMAALWEADWGRWGWPVEVGGLGGSILHRAAMWEVLARHGVPGMALFEHLEILAPTLVALGPRDLVAAALPRLLSGQELWCQGFSEPDAGSDLASLRTRAVLVDGDWTLNGRKIWTSWARYARWCLVLARTGPVESRHRGLTALVVDLQSPGVEVTPIVQANGTDELAEVSFDDVHVPADHLVGEVDGGWHVAMHILSSERGTFAWFRHLFLYQHLRAALPLGDPRNDGALGNSLLDLAAVTAMGLAGLQQHVQDAPLGPLAAYPKLLLCSAEQSVHDWILAADPDIAIDVALDPIAVRRQEYLFSRIVTVYGGSQQMQLETIAKQNLHLP